MYIDTQGGRKRWRTLALLQGTKAKREAKKRRRKIRGRDDKRKKVITTRELTGIKVNSRTNVYSNYALVIFILEDWSVK